ncbi:MAG TPA: hypothetical protein VF746_31855 [Longimicrobium sp.]|jgi:hypothetical protein
MADNTEIAQAAAASPAKSAATKKPKTKKQPAKPAKSGVGAAKIGSKREKGYPSEPLEQVLVLGAGIVNYAGGDKIRRLTLMQKLGRSPNSSAVRVLITNSSKYGVTIGSYKAEWIELTPDGRIACDDTQTHRDRTLAKFRLAIQNIPPFKAIYEEYVNKRVPAPEVMKDFLESSSFYIDDPRACLDVFVVNAKDLGLLQTIGGAETLVSVEHVLEELASTPQSPRAFATPPLSATNEIGTAKGDWAQVCFYVTPIGEEGSEQRKHADLFMGSIVQPAIEELGLRVVRADQIGSPGMITSQIIEHIKRSRLVVADLSTLNPNVFYETALRHACRLPIVQIIRKVDRIPFDTNQVRTVVIDTTDIYTLVPKIATYQAEIATQARAALEDPENAGNPISVFYPAFWK